MTTEEKKKVISKGRGWLLDYLNDEADVCLKNVDANTRKHLMKVIADRYRALMTEDDEFFGEVSTFVSQRRSAEEKKTAMYAVARTVVSSGVRADYARRYPCEYTMP